MKKIIAIVLAVLLMIPTGITAMAADKIITNVTLPVNKTYFYTDAAIESPQFYSTLECMVDGVMTTLSGFTWTSSDYKSTTAGTYTFSAVAPSGYAFRGGVPTITVDMKSGSPTSHTGYFMSRDYAGNRVSVIAETEETNLIYDRTGHYNLRPTYNSVSTSVRILGGIDYTRTMTTATTADIALYSGDIRSIYGGSFGTNFMGVSNVHVEGGSVDGIYAGSVNGTFEGTTNIYIYRVQPVSDTYIAEVIILRLPSAEQAVPLWEHPM